MRIGAIIPTRNRIDSLRRLLLALEGQTLGLFEIIVVDSSDRDHSADLLHAFPSLPLQVVRSRPSVCHQRNTGIRRASADLLFLCDDDMEPEPEYVRTLAAYLVDHPERSVATGHVCESGPDGEVRDLPRISFRRLLWNTLFFLGVWTDLDTVRVPGGLSPLMTLLRRGYARKGNTLTRAGWPLVTEVRGPVFHTAVFGLGACVARRHILAGHPFDEIFDERGIGDNYAFALGLGSGQDISVVTSVRVRHHRDPGGGVPSPEIYARRVLALDYVLTKKRNGGSGHRPALLWSLLGSLLAFSAHRNVPLVRTCFHLMRLIAGGTNPYLRASKAAQGPPPVSAILPKGLMRQ